MLTAGEVSGDLLAAELVKSLRQEIDNSPPIKTPDFQPLHTSLRPRFFGAGGPNMAAGGVDLAFDLTQHSVTGLSDVLKGFVNFGRLFYRLRNLGLSKQPDVVICVDFSGFNRRLAAAFRRYRRTHRSWFHDWDPKLVQYVSPQVWASREGRAYGMARDYDLLLSILPFEREWYARRVPGLRVEFIGHPLVDRYANLPTVSSRERRSGASVLLLPGSRIGELSRHLPVMRDTLVILRESIPELHARLVLPNETLMAEAKRHNIPQNIELRVGGLAEALSQADVAIASTGTVTLECAFFRVPTVALYKTSLSTYLIARQIIQVKYLAMPNLLANEPIFPELLQDAATPENIAQATLELLRDESRRAGIKARLSDIVSSLGTPGASRRGAQAILRLLDPANPHVRK
jgi:lipid-A-disaccharide synthase